MLGKRWKLLIDFDGTLHDTEYVYAQRLDGLLDLDGRELFRTFLFDIHRKIVHEHYPQRHNDLDLHWKLLLEHLGEPFDAEKINLLTLHFKEAERAVLENPRLFPDVSQFLDQVAKAHHRLCLSTGGGTSLEKAEALTRELGTNYFKNVVGEEILGCLKHEPLYYERALKKLSWKAENTISIGDTILTDIHPAKVVGIRTIWVNRRNEKTHTKPNYTPDHETSNLVCNIHENLRGNHPYYFDGPERHVKHELVFGFGDYGLESRVVGTTTDEFVEAVQQFMKREIARLIESEPTSPA